MEYQRLNITQLAKKFRTDKSAIREWIRKGYLKPVQILGNQKKFTVDGFLSAELLALEEKQAMVENQLRKYRKASSKGTKKEPGAYDKITAEHWANVFA